MLRCWMAHPFFGLCHLLLYIAWLCPHNVRRPLASMLPAQTAGLEALTAVTV